MSRNEGHALLSHGAESDVLHCDTLYIGEVLVSTLNRCAVVLEVRQCLPHVPFVANHVQCIHMQGYVLSYAQFHAPVSRHLLPDRSICCFKHFLVLSSAAQHSPSSHEKQN